MIEAAEPLAKDDPELAAVVLDRLRAEGVKVLSPQPPSGRSAQPTERDRRRDRGCRSDRGHAICWLPPAGRPNIEGLDLEAAGIAHHRKGHHGRLGA